MSLFGRNLKKMLETKGMQQKELVLLSGVGRTQISNYINNKNEVTENNLIKICKALQISPNELLDWKDNEIDTDSLIGSICLLEGFNKDAYDDIHRRISELKQLPQYKAKTKDSVC